MAMENPRVARPEIVETKHCRALEASIQPNAIAMENPRVARPEIVDTKHCKALRGQYTTKRYGYGEPKGGKT